MMSNLYEVCPKNLERNLSGRVRSSPNTKPKDLREAQFIQLLENVSILWFPFIPHDVDARVGHLRRMTLRFDSSVSPTDFDSGVNRQGHALPLPNL